MAGPAHKSGCQKIQEVKKKKKKNRGSLWGRGSKSSCNDHVTNFFWSAHKAAPSRAEEANDSQEANVTANVTGQVVASVS